MTDDDPDKIAEFENYIRGSKYVEVEPLLAAYVKDHPASSWGWYALGYSQFAQKKIGDSIKSLAQCLSLNVKNADAHKILGRDLMIIGRFDAAQTEFEQAIRYAPNSSESHYDLGKLFSLQDNWLAARKQFEDAISLDPGYIEAIDSPWGLRRKRWATMRTQFRAIKRQSPSTSSVRGNSSPLM